MAGFQLLRLYHFNALAILGWFFYGSVLRRKRVPERPAGLFDRLVPILRRIERTMLRGKAGVSLIAVCER